MSDRAFTTAMWIVLPVLAIGMSVVTTWFLVTYPKRIERIQNISTEIVAREEYALQRLATLLGAPYTPGRTVDIPYGGSWPAAGTVDHHCRHLQVRVTFGIYNNLAVEGPGECWYLPLVAIDVPQGERWVVESAKTLGKTINGDTVRERAASGRTSGDFQRVFGVREDALPPGASALLWSVGERSHRIEFSWRGVEIFFWPSDVVERQASSFSKPTIWEGGYDPNELVPFIDEACALAASLLVPAAPGAIDAGRR